MQHTCAYKYKLKLSSTQEEKAYQWIGVCRLIYNMALSISKETWEKFERRPSRMDLQKQLTALRAEFDWVKAVQSQVLQSPLFRLERAYEKFFSGAGFPKFAKKGGYSSFTFPQKVRFEQGRFWLPKFGWVRVHKDRWPTAMINQATVIYDCGQWYLSVTFKKEIIPMRHCEKQVGIDMGVRHFVTTDKGIHYENPQLWQRYARQLRIEQRSLGRKKKFGNNWRKQVQRIAKLHQKIARVRHDHQHKVANALIRQFDVIVIENLKVKNQTGSAKGTLENPGKNVKSKSGLNRAILDTAPGAFFAKLEYKSAWYARELLRVNPKNTSRTCFQCGDIAEENRKGEVFLCKCCGHQDHADVNAAKNILARAMASTRQRKAVA